MENGVSMCAFAANIITGHCASMRTLNHPISESLTYHIPCAKAEDKASFMREHMTCMTECPFSLYKRSNNEICDFPTCKYYENYKLYYHFIMIISVVVLLYIWIYRNKLW